MDITEWKTAISGNDSFESLLVSALKRAGDDPTRFYKVCKKGMMLALSKTDEERGELLEHPDATVRALMEARLALRSWPLHIARVNSLVAMANADGAGCLPIPLRYAGAHTGRFAGTEGINPQNFGSRGDPLISSIRNMIVAPDGHVLIIVDSAQIEARVNDFIAGQWDSCEKWRQNVDQYSEFASRVVGWTVRKPQKSGIGIIEQRHGWARNSIGKVGVLGCGYGMGATKAVGYAQGTIDLATAESIVKTYRETHKEVVKFWKDIEKAFIYTAKYHRPCELARGLRFDSTDDCAVIITLPNGREIHYHSVKIVQDKYGEKAEVYNEIEHHWEHIWGGTLCENVVQAMSRDALVEPMLRLEAQGIHTAVHVHDELVMIASEDKANEVLKLAILEMGRTPSWAPGLPLSSEGTISKFYKK